MNLYVGAGRWTGGTLGGLFRSREAEGEWERLGQGLPDAIHVQAITIHPNDDNVVFIAADGGLYRSDDAGTRWRRLDVPPNRQFWSLAVHPTDPRRLYAGTSPVGVMRSVDGGESWQECAAASIPARVKMKFACRVMRIAIEPGNPEHLFAALEVGGVMRSFDGGESWSDCAADLVRLAEQHPALRSQLQSDTENEGMLDAHAVAVSAARAGSVFVAVRMGLFESVDSGGAWSNLDVGRFSPLTYARDVVVSPHDARVMFACLSPAAASKDGSLYRSDDLGANWSRIDRGIKANATMMAVALDRNDRNSIHCVSRCGQAFSTLDGGQSWRETKLPEGVLDVYATACA